MIERVLEVYRRPRGLLRRRQEWGWRLVVNGNVVATDGGQGYQNEAEAEGMGRRVVSGAHAEAVLRLRD